MTRVVRSKRPGWRFERNFPDEKFSYWERHVGCGIALIVDQMSARRFRSWAVDACGDQIKGTFSGRNPTFEAACAQLVGKTSRILMMAIRQVEASR